MCVSCEPGVALQSSMEWDDEKCLHLIEIYKNKPILWHPKDINYCKKHLKEDAWIQEGEIFVNTTNYLRF
jgi:hypothetical protein